MSDEDVLPDPKNEPMISPQRAARILGVSKATVFRLAARSEFPIVRVGSSYRIPSKPFLETYGLDDIHERRAPRRPRPAREQRLHGVPA